MEWLNYLLKVSACLTLFFAFYLLVLRKLTFFKANRFYLLLALIGSFIIPNLQFTVEREVEQVPILAQSMPLEQVQQLATSNNNAPLVAIANIPVEENINWLSLLPWLYLVIVFTLIAIACWRIWKLVKHTHQGAKPINGLKLVTKTDGFTNCSFFNYVFIDDKNLTSAELEILLKHERIHAKQFHSLDKMIMVLAKAVLWFNPIIYLYDKALEQNHEYEADNATSMDCGTNPYAQLLLQLAVSNNKIALVHNFVKSPIKERIKMLFKDKSKNMKKLMYLLALPLGLMLLWGFTVRIVDVMPMNNSVQENAFTLVIDPSHGGNDKGMSVNGITEKAITLEMAKKIKALAEAEGISVTLTRLGDENPSIAERTKTPGVIFLSLHLNGTPSTTKNGIEFITSGKYGKDLKLAKANTLTYHLYKNLKDLTGIKVNNKPQQQSIPVLDQTNMPGIVLEMGNLNNKSDFKFITNAQQQDELARLIVKGIKIYKERVSVMAKMTPELQQKSEEFLAKYRAWTVSAERASLQKEAKKIKNQTITGKIQSLHYFQRGGIPTLDGFILNANHKYYRVYLTQELLDTTPLNRVMK
jgi:N-acetylmuramoyl-L-alanine amidase